MTYTQNAKTTKWAAVGFAAVFTAVGASSACGHKDEPTGLPKRLMHECQPLLTVKDYAELCPTLAARRAVDDVVVADAQVYSEPLGRLVRAARGATCSIALRANGGETDGRTNWSTLKIDKYRTHADAVAAAPLAAVSPFWLHALGARAHDQVGFFDRTAVVEGVWIISFYDAWLDNSKSEQGLYPEDGRYCTPAERPALMLRLIERLPSKAP